MVRILQAVAVLLVIGILAVIAYAYIGDMAPKPGEQRQEIVLPNVEGGASASETGAASGN